MHRIFLVRVSLAVAAVALAAPLAFAASDEDAMGSAEALALGETHDGEIAGERPRECYRVDNGGRAVTVFVEVDDSMRAPLHDRALRVYDAGGSKLGESEISDSQEPLSLKVTTQAQSIFVCVGGVDDSWSGAYRLRVEA